MISTFALLAAQDLSSTQVLWFLVEGLVVVLTTLILLAVFCTAIGAAFQQAKTAIPDKSVVPTSDEVPAEVQVVIAAAVATVIEKAHRIAHIGCTTDDAWAHDHRHQLHTSHQVHHRD